MLMNSGARWLFAGCMSAALFAALPAAAEDNGFGVGNGGIAAPAGAAPSPAAAAAASTSAPVAAAPSPAPLPAGKGASNGQMIAPVVCIADLGAIMGTSSAAKNVATQRDGYAQSYQTELTKDEQALSDTKKKLDQERQGMSQDAFAEKAKAFEQSVGDFQRKVMIRRNALEKAFATGMAQIERGMVEAVGTAASAHGCNIVFPRSQVYMFADAMNISKEASDNLNRKLPKVDMPKPELDGGDGAKKK